MPKREHPSGRLVSGDRDIRVDKGCFSCLFKHKDKEIYGGVEVYLNVFVASALDGEEWSAAHPSKSSWYPFDWKLNVTQSSSRRCG